ncbi:serpin-ZXA-like [Cornus florida]|uniref:serpin-ZXA-like n=1 Tax=Cornus florida TaxID=4283 RepID=UPI00289BA3E5|nr:serpin-ZXA-like [Cornus florida]
MNLCSKVAKQILLKEASGTYGMKKNSVVSPLSLNALLNLAAAGSTGATEEVNSWVEKTTKGLIKNIIPEHSLDQDTMIVLANALYFKGAWNSKFDASMTEDGDFHLLSGETVSVPLMTTSYSEYHFYGSFDGVKLVKMPYQKGEGSSQFSMYIFLPSERNGLQNLIETVEVADGIMLHQLSSHLKEVKLDEFWIPKFKFSYGLEASNYFKELGLTKPFQRLGEFKGMSDSVYSEELFVSGVLHKSSVEANEEGTVAAAATTFGFVGCARFPPSKPSFVADHPFMFVIREEISGTLLFIGAVLNPSLH